ncbi:hypothetical protein [Microbacterium sp. H1-D42]|uniref:hypothetical protein n=1 Tax=Microbacterium sp. H1-D42 TaxID=2925844 RepID=UPI001F53D577|nr:hypothetical protein [Microbacterium sp. H1-D42]UNK71980.1 hypothetical protein MNR00_05895 [Microbacterium sp. H1-D42]
MAENARRLDLRPLRSDAGVLLLVLLLLVDVMVLVLHLTYTLFGVPGGMHFDLGVDRSYGEFLLYIKFGWVAVLGFVLARRRGAAIFAVIGVVSLVVLLEDALILHERIGWALNPVILDAVPGLAGLGILSVQIGELAWLGALAAGIGIAFLLAFRRTQPDDRRDALSIAVFFVLLGFFAVGVDTVHSLFSLGSAGDIVFTLLEDGGEILALTPAVALIFALVLSAAEEDQTSITTSSTDLSERRPRQRA